MPEADGEILGAGGKEERGINMARPRKLPSINSAIQANRESCRKYYIRNREKNTEY